MFEKIKKFLSDSWKKILWTLAATVSSYLILRYLVPTFLSLSIVSGVGAGLVGYLVWTKVALWEIEKLLDEAKASVKKVV